ncbi:hypothetical protein MC885_012873, partial [Smutsia gigantea]
SENYKTRLVFFIPYFSSHTSALLGLCPSLKGKQEGMAAVSPTARYQQDFQFLDLM